MLFSCILDFCFFIRFFFLPQLFLLLFFSDIRESYDHVLKTRNKCGLNFVSFRRTVSTLDGTPYTSYGSGVHGAFARREIRGKREFSACVSHTRPAKRRNLGARTDVPVPFGARVKRNTRRAHHNSRRYKIGTHMVLLLLLLLYTWSVIVCVLARKTLRGFAAVPPAAAAAAASVACPNICSRSCSARRRRLLQRTTRLARARRQKTNRLPPSVKLRVVTARVRRTSVLEPDHACAADRCRNVLEPSDLSDFPENNNGFPTTDGALAVFFFTALERAVRNAVLAADLGSRLPAGSNAVISR